MQISVVCELKAEILNGGRRQFKNHLNVLIAYQHHLNNCMETNPTFNQHSIHGLSIAKGLKDIIRSNDHGLQPLVLQFDPLTSFRRRKRYQLNRKCSKAQSAVDFESRLMRIVRGLIKCLKDLQFDLQPVTSRCRTSRRTPRPHVTSYTREAA